MIRLTRKQTDQLISIALSGAWGKVFVAFSIFEWLFTKGLVRKATGPERDAHYAGIERELTTFTAQIGAAAAVQNWAQVKMFAESAEMAAMELRDRLEDQDRLVVLTDAAVEFARAAKARKEAK